MSLLYVNFDKPPAVQFNNISFSHGQLPVLKQLNLSIPEGQWVSIAGHNGSGKSTLVRLINGLLHAQSGQVSIHGTALDDTNLYQLRSKIGYIFASPDNQFIGLTIRDDIAFGLENLCLPREIIEERINHYAKMFQLTELLDRHPATLSGGQKQRAALAAVLAMQPSILILDEATSMLDSSFRDFFLKLITKLNREEHMTIISISHDIKELAASERLIILHDGAILADGKPDILLIQQQLLQACRLEMPYALQLCHELKKQGIDIGETIDEQEVQHRLWALLSSKSLIATKSKACSNGH